MSRASDLCTNTIKTLQKLFEKLDSKLMVPCDEYGLMDELTEWGPCTYVHKAAEHNISLPSIPHAFGSIELVSSILGCNLEMQKIPFCHSSPSERLKIKVSKGIIIWTKRNDYDLFEFHNSLMYFVTKAIPIVQDRLKKYQINKQPILNQDNTLPNQFYHHSNIVVHNITHQIASRTSQFSN